jgi:hypothetical protein
VYGEQVFFEDLKGRNLDAPMERPRDQAQVLVIVSVQLGWGGGIWIIEVAPKKIP